MKNLMNLGKILSKNEQTAINGGRFPNGGFTCGLNVFNSIESQCLSLILYQPQWNASNNTCSIIYFGPNCTEIEE